MIQELFLKLFGSGINFIGLFSSNLAGQIALKVYRKPREGRLEFSDLEFLKTAESKTKIGKTGCKVMRYSWNESGKKEVLLLHGWESNAARWEPVILKFVENNYRVVAIDAPAHGDSDRELFDMVQYVNAIDAAVEASIPHFIIGHSLGGSSLSFYLNRIDHPKFEKIVLMGVPSELYEMTVNFGEMLGLNQRSFNALVKTFRSTFDLDLKDISVKEFCKNITIETLILHDYQDEIANVEDAKVYQQILNSAELYLTKDYDHSLQAEEVYNCILSFIQK